MRLTLTGALTIDSDAGIVDEDVLGGRQGRLLCAFFVAERHRATEREELAEVLWPLDLPASWEPSLRAVVSKVRRFFASGGLPEDVLTHAFGCYQLHLPLDVEVDVEELVRDVEASEDDLRAGRFGDACERAEAAASIAKSPFLSGIDAPWAERKRGELRAWLVRCLEVLAAARIAKGEPAPAVTASEEALTCEPFRETAHRLVMEAHAAAGNRAEALRSYERCRDLLSTELGADPSPETEALYLEILQAERGPAAARRQGPRIASDIQTDGVDLIGREHEWSTITEAWAAAKEGRLRLVLVEGEPGIGKTRLLNEAARTLTSGDGVALQGLSAEEAGLPYLPFVEALRRYIALRPDDLAHALGPLGGELGRLVPTLRHRIAGLPEPVRAEPETARYRLFEAVTGWLATASAAEPVVLTLDDLQWADKPSLLLLRHLVRAVEGLRVLVLGAYRGVDVGPGHQMSGLLDDLRDASGVDRVVLTGLSTGEMETFLASSGIEGAPAVVKWVHGQTRGNPLFSRELFSHLVEVGALSVEDHRWTIQGSLEGSGVPPQVRQVIYGRLSRLREPTTTVLSLASVLGIEFDVGLLVRLSDNSEEEVLDTLDHARRAGFVTDAPAGRDRSAFVHALVRAALYDELSAPRRMRLHLRAARSLEPMVGPGGRVDELAHHYAAAAPLGESERAVRFSRLAGDRARADLAFEQAAGHYERALTLAEAAGAVDLGVRCDIRIGLGESLNRAGDPRHRPVLVEAANDARALGDARRLGRAALALNKMGNPSAAGGPEPAIIGMLGEALDALPAADDELRARLLATLAVELLWTADAECRARLAEEAKAMARRLGPRMVAAVAYATHTATSGPHNLEQRLEETRELTELGTALDDREPVCQGYILGFDGLVESGDVADADAALRTAERLVNDLRQPFMAWEVAIRRAGRALLAGRLDEADDLVQSAFALGGDHDIPPTQLMGVYISQLLWLRFEQGRLNELATVIDSFAEISLSFARAVSAFALAETGRLEDARVFLGEATNAVLRAEYDLQWLGGTVLLSQACAALGGADSARALYPLLVPFAGRMSWVTCASPGPTDLALGLLAATSGDLDAAGGHFADATQLCERMGAEGWLTRTRCEWAHVKRPAGDEAAARELASAAAVEAAERGQMRLAARAKRLLEELSAVRD